MKPLILLLAVFLAGILFSRIALGNWNWIFNGNLAMCLMLCFTAIGHFKFADGMAMMLPGFLPLKKETVYLTGVIEVAIGLLLLLPQYRFAAAIILIVFLVLVLPANIHAAINNVDYEKATNTGKGLAYLWFRVPMQLLLIAWAFYFSIRQSL
jgi:uncharacterized membrane protein